MSEPSEPKIEPFFNDDIKNIHPAIGTVEGVAYIGVWVPCKVTDDKGHVTTKDFLYLVTSERQAIIGLSHELIRRQWKLNYKPIHYKENRWNLSDVQAYLNGAEVDPDQVFQSTLKLYKDFVELPSERLYVLHTLWSIGTYFHIIFNSFPYLYIGGVKRSGKTKTLTVHSVIDFNAIFSNNMSSATLYRLIQNSRGTLLIDESEKLSNPQRAQEFRNILLAGYKKGPDTYRCGKDAKERIEPEGYAVYGPKGIGNIGGLEDVLEDRCISQFQQRTRNKAIANKEIDLLDVNYAKLRGQLCILFLQHWKEISEIYSAMAESSELSELNDHAVIAAHGGGGEPVKDSEPSELSEEAKDTFSNITIVIKDSDEAVATCATPVAKADVTPEGSEYVAGRELELWKPIYTLAKFFAKYNNSNKIKGMPFAPSQGSQGSLITQMIELSCILAKQRHIENTTEVGEENLIRCLLEMNLVNQLVNWVKIKDVKVLMGKRFEEGQDWLTTAWIGRALRRLGFTNKRRLGTGYEYDIPSVTLEDLRERMQIEKEGEVKKVEPILTQENVQKVLTALIEAGKERGSATTQEVAEHSKLGDKDVDAVLKQLEKEGKVSSPYPNFWKVNYP